MELLTILVGICLLYLTGIREWNRGVRQSNHLRFQRQFSTLQICAIKKAYPPLENLSREELEARYDISALYWKIPHY